MTPEERDAIDRQQERERLAIVHGPKPAELIAQRVREFMDRSLAEGRWDRTFRRFYGDLRPKTDPNPPRLSC